MDILIIGAFILVTPILIYIRWKVGTKKNFDHLIDKKLYRHGLKLLKSEYPGIFNVGPFPKFKIEPGKPQINNGAIQYERTYFRKLQVLKSNKEKIEVWAKIETSWFKDTTVEFKPNLNEIKQKTGGNKA